MAPSTQLIWELRQRKASDDGARKAICVEAGEVVEVQHPSELPGFHDAISQTVPS